MDMVMDCATDVRTLQQRLQCTRPKASVWSVAEEEEEKALHTRHALLVACTRAVPSTATASVAPAEKTIAAATKAAQGAAATAETSILAASETTAEAAAITAGAAAATEEVAASTDEAAASVAATTETARTGQYGRSLMEPEETCRNHFSPAIFC